MNSDYKKFTFLNFIILALILLPGIWAFFNMKFRFNVAPDLTESSVFIASGIYKYIRHPMYFSVLGSALFFIVLNYNIVNLTAWILLLIDLILKLNFEEKLLAEKFNDYKNYISNTKRLIPYIYLFNCRELNQMAVCYLN